MPQQFVQNPLEQFEPEKLSVGWPWKLFLGALTVFSAAILVYLGLTFGYEPYLNSRIAEKTAGLEELKKAISKKDAEDFGIFYSRLVNLENLLNNHVLASKVFPALEQITNQKVYYENANLRVAARELALSGVAESYAALTEQLESFKEAEQIERYTVNQSEATGNTVKFRAILKLKSDVLK